MLMMQSPIWIQLYGTLFLHAQNQSENETDLEMKKTTPKK